MGFDLELISLTLLWFLKRLYLYYSVVAGLNTALFLAFSCAASCLGRVKNARQCQGCRASACGAKTDMALGLALTNLAVILKTVTLMVSSFVINAGFCSVVAL